MNKIYSISLLKRSISSIIFFILLSGVAVSFFSSCKQKKEQTEEIVVIQAPPVEIEEVVSETPSITNEPEYNHFGTRPLPVTPKGLTGKAIELVADPKVYPDTVSKITIILHNQKAGDLTTGLFYQLEKYDKGEWIPLNFPENYAYPEIGLILNQGSSLEFLTRLHPEVNHYTPGKYRVIKEQLFKFETDFIVDSAYNLRMTSSNHLGDAFEMTVWEIRDNPSERIDTLQVIIANHSNNQELINTDDFILSYHDGEYLNDILRKSYSGFKEKTYSLSSGRSMQFSIPVMSDKYRSNSGKNHTFGPGKYTVTKWSKVNLYAEFELR